MDTVLVVGGAGYIGSHTCLALSAKGYKPVVFDNLLNGHQEFVKWGPFENGDINDRARLAEVIRAHRPVAIVHFAALIEVGESVQNPIAFFQNNVAGSISLLQAAMQEGIDKLVFSSTCATYGEPQFLPLDETHPQNPVSPYGRTKLMVEQVLAELDRYKGFRSVVLRYFNAAGADPQGRIGEWHDPETHAIPLAIQTALGRRDAFKVFGTDYETRDGTCVRDFVHVMDLADAHVRAVDYLLSGGTSTALNLGTGHGTTVSELLAAVSAASGKAMAIIYTGRRAGDPPTLVADNQKARQTLGWTPMHDLQSIIRSAWDWHARSNLT